jgi:hypothetical protein
MYKQRYPTRSKYKIRRAWQVLGMKGIPQSKSVEEAADDHLWLGIFTLDRSHDVASLRSCNVLGHRWSPLSWGQSLSVIASF